MADGTPAGATPADDLLGLPGGGLIFTSTERLLMVPTTRLLIAVFSLLGVCGSLLAGAPASTSPPAGCHGTKAAAVRCHGEAEEALQVAEASAGCHGRHRLSFAERHAYRVAGRTAARADQASARSERAAGRAGCHGAKAATATGCHGATQAEAPDECD